MLTSEFNALLRQYEDRQLEKFFKDQDDKEPPADIEPACLECTQRGPKCFQCGFGYGG